MLNIKSGFESGFKYYDEFIFDPLGCLIDGCKFLANHIIGQGTHGQAAHQDGANEQKNQATFHVWFLVSD